MEWFRQTLVKQGKIGPQDLNLIYIVDEPEEVVETIFSYYEGRPIEPSALEREILMQL